LTVISQYAGDGRTGSVALESKFFAVNIFDRRRSNHFVGLAEMAFQSSTMAESMLT